MNEAEAIRNYRRALLIAFIAPVVEYARFILFSGSILYEGIVTVFAFIFAVSILTLWFFGFRLLMFVSAGFHLLFGGSTTRGAWQQATLSGLWPLPYGCALGVVIWLIYSLGHFGGWPDDVILGTLANLLGAWLYLTIFRQWFILRRSTSYALHATPGNA